MKTLSLILAVSILLSCDKQIIKPKNKPVHIGANNTNYYYGYTILAPADTVKPKK